MSGFISSASTSISPPIESNSLSVNSVSPYHNNEKKKQPNWRHPDRVAWMGSRKFTRSKPTSENAGNLDLTVVEEQKLRELSQSIADIMVFVLLNMRFYVSFV